MFYNGFTLLMQIFAGMSAYWVGNWFGKKRGEREMYYHCQSAQKAVDEYFRDVSRR
jgi:hypothetical protein